MKIFLSWSGDKSRRVALALRNWLPAVINSVEPFVSSKDIDPGRRWQAEVADQLEATSFGIVSVTRDNRSSAWLNFEAGALAKAVESSHVIPLAVDLKPSDIALPLGQFQAQPATREGLEGIVNAINSASPEPLESGLLERAFRKWWPDLEEELRSIEEKHAAPIEEARTDRELIEETLNVVRGLARPRRAALPRSGGPGVDNGTAYIDRFPVGQQVSHVAFGQGRVIGREPDGVAIIRFDDGSERKLMVQFAPIVPTDEGLF